MKMSTGVPVVLLCMALSGCGEDSIQDIGQIVYVQPNPATRDALAQYAQANPDPDDPTGVRVTFVNLPVTPCLVGLYDQYGELIAEVEKPGDEDHVSWNLRANTGQQVTGGVYHFTIRTAGDDAVIASGTFFASP